MVNEKEKQSLGDYLNAMERLSFFVKNETEVCEYEL